MGSSLKPKGWPSEVRLFSRKWRIVYCRPEHPALNPSEDESLLGCCDPQTHTIYLEAGEGVCRELLLDTLVHELYHACFHKMPGCAETGSRDDEQAVLTATKGFWEIVRNIKGIKWT